MDAMARRVGWTPSVIDKLQMLPQDLDFSFSFTAKLLLGHDEIIILWQYTSHPAYSILK